MSEFSVQRPFSIGRQRKRARYAALDRANIFVAPVKISASELHPDGNGTCRREGTFLGNPCVEFFLDANAKVGKDLFSVTSPCLALLIDDFFGFFRSKKSENVSDVSFEFALDCAIKKRKR